MKKANYRTLKITVSLLLLLTVSGCWSRHELNTLAVVIGMGLDKVEGNRKIQATAQIFNAGESKGGISKQAGSGSKTESSMNIENTGDNLYEIIKGLANQLNHKLYFPDNQALILSSELAKEGVQKYLDFFVRDHETRLTVWILVSKNKASEVLEFTPKLEKTSAMYISQLVEAQTETSEAPKVNLGEFISRLMSKTSAATAPLIEVKGKGEDQILIVKGTAVFKEDKLIGQLDGRETRGLLWVNDEIEKGTIEVDSPSGDGKVSMEITRSKSKITPEIIDGNIDIKIMIREEGNIIYQSTGENLSKVPAVEYLEKEQAAVIEKEAIAALEKAKNWKADIFSFGELIHQQYPKEWLKIKDRWDEVFPQIEVEFDIETKLRRTGRISSPTVPEQEQ